MSVDSSTSQASPPLHGQMPIRGNEKVPFSSIETGRFGRMFRRLPPMPPLSQEQLENLANQMLDEDSPGSGWGGEPTPRDNHAIPAGYTYFGQFIDHDITFDPISTADRANDPDALHNFRTPRFDLDSVYGSGPVDEPFQYVPGKNGMELLIEPNRNKMEDLPRNSRDVALIGDPRNDENTIVSQMHLGFLKLHNKVAAEVAGDDSIPESEKFFEAQRRVRWHYQWAVFFDYIPRIVGEELFESMVEREDDGTVRNVKRRFYKPKTIPYMPLEFSGAAFRFGHSMVRGIYNLNNVVTDRPIFIPGPLPDELADLRGFRGLPFMWNVDWDLFFSTGPSPQPSRVIDARLVRGLFTLPEGGSLPFLNLRKGQILELPSGQHVARFMKVEPVPTADLGTSEPTPLWFYILKEAEVVAGGRHLGPVGGRIVAEVLLGLVELDKLSWLNWDPTWRPTIPDADGDGVVGVGDLLKFAAPFEQAQAAP